MVQQKKKKTRFSERVRGEKDACPILLVQQCSCGKNNLLVTRSYQTRILSEKYFVGFKTLL